MASNDVVVLLPGQPKTTQGCALRRPTSQESLMMRRHPCHLARRLAAHAERRAQTKEIARVRCQEMQRARQACAAAHNAKVMHARQQRPRRSHVCCVREKLQRAEERRQQLREAEAERLSRHHSSISMAKSRSKQTSEQEARKIRAAIKGYRAQRLREVATTSDFYQMRHKLLSRETLRAAQDLLGLILRRIALVDCAATLEVGDDTPIAASPQRGLQRPPASDLPEEVPALARELLTAYMTAGGVDETSDGPLAEAVTAGAKALLSTLSQLLRLLESDATAAGGCTRHALQQFARQWETYQAAFAAWKSSDKTDLLDHYMRVYGDVERGRCSVSQQHTPGRRESNHRELVAAIDEELEQLRSRIERLGGPGALSELERRLHSSRGSSTPPTPPVTPPGRSISFSSTPSPFQRHECREVDRAAVAAALAAAVGSAPPPAAEVQPPASAGACAFSVGDKVVAQGLQQAPQLNGSLGTVVGRRGERIAVDFGPRGTKLLKEVNLRQAPVAHPGLPELRLRAQLAHDAAIGHAVGGLPTPQPTPVSAMADAVREQTERALWDMLPADLSARPPVADRLGMVLGTLRAELIELAPRAHRAKLEQEMDECCDWSTISRSLNYRTLSEVCAFFWSKVAYYGAPADEEANRRRAAEVARRIADGGDAADVVPGELRGLLDAVRALRRQCDEERAKLAAPVLRRGAREAVRGWAAAMHSADGMPLAREWLKRCLHRHFGSAPSDINLPVSREEVLGMTKAAVCETLPRVAILDAITLPATADPLPEVLHLSRAALADLASTAQRLTYAAAAATLCGAHVHVSCARQRQPGAVDDVRKQVATGMNSMLKEAQQEGGHSLSTVAMRATECVDEALVTRGLPPLRDEQRRLLAGEPSGPDATQGLILRMTRQTEDGLFADRTMALISRRLRGALADYVFGRSDPAALAAAGSPFHAVSGEVIALGEAVAGAAALLTDWFRPQTDVMLLSLTAELRAEEGQ